MVFILFTIVHVVGWFVDLFHGADSNTSIFKVRFVKLKCNFLYSIKYYEESTGFRYGMVVTSLSSSLFSLKVD